MNGMGRSNRSLTVACCLFFVVVSCEEIYENSAQICTRCKCVTSDDAQIVDVDCSERDLHKMWASWPAHNATLRVDLSKNNLTTLQKLPPSDAQVEAVFSHCHIQDLYPEAFEDVVNIKSVDLSFNLLTAEDLTSDTFKGPYSDNKPTEIALEHLNLAFNDIHSLNKNVFRFVPNLRSLNLAGNNFAVLDVHTQMALASVPKLQDLNVAYNELTELVAGAIEKLQSLQNLDISNNCLDFVPQSLEVVGGSLQVLKLDANPIISIDAKSFAKLHKLVEISANQLTKLGRISGGAFNDTTSLTTLSLCDNPMLGSIDIDAFPWNQTLQELYLNYDNLTDLPFGLLEWSNLAAFQLKGNPLACSCDLYHIFGTTSPAIKNINPTCLHPSTQQPIQLHLLKSDICMANVQSALRPMVLRRRLSVPLALLIASLLCGILVAAGLGYGRYRRIARDKNLSSYAAAQIAYRPL